VDGGDSSSSKYFQYSHDRSYIKNVFSQSLELLVGPMAQNFLSNPTVLQENYKRSPLKDSFYSSGGLPRAGTVVNQAPQSHFSLFQNINRRFLVRYLIIPKSTKANKFKISMRATRWFLWVSKNPMYSSKPRSWAL